MAPRVGLQETLCDILLDFMPRSDARKRVYYQPPTGYRIEYPCIVYELDRIQNTHANNHPYIGSKRYSLTVIDQNPDSEIRDEVANLPYCSMDRSFVTEGLYHSVFTIYY